MGGGGYWEAKAAWSVIVQAPWLLPDEQNFDWKIPLAALALVPIFMAMSVVIEFVILNCLLAVYKIRVAWRDVWIIHALSYGAIVAFWLVMLGIAVFERIS